MTVEYTFEEVDYVGTHSACKEVSKILGKRFGGV